MTLADPESWFQLLSHIMHSFVKVHAGMSESVSYCFEAEDRRRAVRRVERARSTCIQRARTRRTVEAPDRRRWRIESTTQLYIDARDIPMVKTN